MRVGGRSHGKLRPFSGKTTAAQCHPHRNASARAGVARRVDIGNGDVARDSLISQSDDVHRHAQLAIRFGRGIDRFVVGLSAIGKDKDAEREPVAEPAGELLECPVEPGFIVLGAQAVVMIGKGRDVAAEAESLDRGSSSLRKPVKCLLTQVVAGLGAAAWCFQAHAAGFIQQKDG